MSIYLHGLETEERDAGNPRFVADIDSAIGFMVGTAPEASDTLYPYNQPRVMRGYNGYPEGLGKTGTLPLQLDLVLRQAGKSSATIYFVRVEEDADPNVMMANIIGDRAARTGLHAISRIQPEFGERPKLLAAPGFTSTRPTDSVASLTVSEAGAGYDPENPPAVTVTRGSGDTTGFGAEIVPQVSQSDGSLTLVIVNGGQAYTETPTITVDAPPSGGTQALATATVGTLANPVAMALSSLCNRYRACAFVTGPNTTNEAAVQYRQDFDTSRLMLIDPMGKWMWNGQIVSAPVEGAMMGLQARLDYQEGFWESPSNRVLEGLLGTHRPIEFSASDRSAESQYLNKNHVSTLVRDDLGGWKAMGVRSMRSDPLHVFWSVRRTHDVIIESIELASRVFLDKVFSEQNLIDVAETVNQALRRWQARGATLGGRVWLDPTVNTAESMSSGIIYVDYDAEGPAPMEHIVFRFNRNVGYYDTLLANAASEIERLSSAAA